MLNLDIKHLIEEINKNKRKIADLKFNVTNLENEVEEKKLRNQSKFEERFEALDMQEKEIKAMFDNKYFKFIKLYDFLDDKEILENIDFEVNEELGCLTKRPKNIIAINNINKELGLDKKSISFKLREKVVINAMEYSFYSKRTNLPLVPKSIYIKYSKYADNFFENYFRYFNSNNKNSFISRYIFEPKLIKEVIFNFDEDVTFENAYLKLFSIKYRDNNSLKILVENYKNLSNFKINKISNEALKSFNFYYSEDNSNYQEIKFEKDNALIKLNKKSDFIIKIESNSEIVKQKQTVNIKEQIISSTDSTSDKGVFELDNDNINIESIKITFPTSSATKLKTIFEKYQKNINDCFDDSAGVMQLKQERLKNVSEVFKDEISRLKFLDDDSLIKNNLNSFCFYFDKEKNALFTPAFLNDFKFFINYQYQETEQAIEDDYYTPILFEFSLKG